MGARGRAGGLPTALPSARPGDDGGEEGGEAAAAAAALAEAAASAARVCIAPISDQRGPAALTAAGGSSSPSLSLLEASPKKLRMLKAVLGRRGRPPLRAPPPFLPARFPPPPPPPLLK